MRILFSTVAKYISLGITNFLDNFAARSNTAGGLGTSTSGDDWEAINGQINVTSGAAKASSTPTSYSSGSAYPMSVVNMKDVNVEIKLKGTNQGSTAAIWVKDSDEWWGVVSRAVQNSTPGNTNYGYDYTPTGNYSYTVGSNTTNYAIFSSNTTNYQVNSSNTTNYKFNSSSTTNSTTNYTQVAFFVYGFNASTTFSASYGTRYNSKYSIAYTKYTWSTTNYGYRVNSTYYGFTSSTTNKTTTNYGTGVAGSTTNYGISVSGSTTNYSVGVDGSTTNYYSGIGTNYGWTFVATGTNATTYAVSQYLDIIQSTASAVSTISSSLVSAVSTIGSILVSLTGNQITAKAYSDTNLVSQIGSDLVYTATGAVIETQFGIAVSPSQYLQSDIIGTSVEINVV